MHRVVKTRWWLQGEREGRVEPLSVRVTFEFDDAHAPQARAGGWWPLQMLRRS